MKFRLALFFVALSAVAAPPHLVVFLSDDHGQADAEVYGARDVRTPAMLRLAREGMTFTNAYVASPACAPSRAALLTGLMPARNGAKANHAAPRSGLKKLPAYLRELGYEVVAFGKIGHYEQTATYGWDHSAHSGFHDLQAVPAALAWLDARTDPRPLCLFVGTNWPHVPWPEKPDLDPAGVALPPTELDTPPTRTARARYLTAVERMDAELGQVFDATRRKLGHDLFFLHTSDHGAQLPFAKWNLYEIGIRVPLLAVWPGKIAAGVRTDALVQWTDILPTLVELGGGSAPADLDGRSFAAVLRGETATHHREIFATHDHDGDRNVYPGRSLRRGNLKYIRNLHPEWAHTTNLDLAIGSAAKDWAPYWNSWLAAAKSDPAAAELVRRYHARPEHELYDLAADPHEQRNVAADPRYADQLRELRARLDAWMKTQGDTGTVNAKPRLLGHLSVQ